MLLLNTGKQCTISGIGQVFEDFLKTGNISNFTGFGTEPAKSHEQHYQEAPLRIMTFAQTYGNMHYDCSQSMH